MKKIFLFTLFAMVIFSGYFFYQSKLSLTKKVIVEQSNLTVYLKIEGMKNFIEHKITKGKTALNFTKEKTITITKGENTNAYVIQINGRKADDVEKEFWAFYVNGKQAEVGAGSYILKDGDKIEWKIEKY